MKKSRFALMSCLMLVSATAFIFAKPSGIHNISLARPTVRPTSTMYISEGRYTIKAVGTDKYLDVDDGENGEIVRMNRIGPSKKDNTWVVKIANGVLGCYTIRNKKFEDKYLDADLGCIDNNGCKVQLWERNSVRINQEWYIEKVSGRDNTYRIRNVQSPKKYIDAKDDVPADSKVKLYERIYRDETQMWVFKKVNE